MRMTVFIKQGVSAILPPLIFALLAGYFIWNALHGEHGTHTYTKQQKIYEQAQHALHDAYQERSIWHRRVNALGEQALDRDMLDERSRTMLNNAQNDDIVIPYAKHEHLY